MPENKNKKFLEYRGRPLVRNGNTIYYGNMSDPYVIVLQISGTKEFNGIELADRVLIQLVSTDDNLRPKDRILKKSEKKGLYNAMDIGTIWLERALEKGVN